MKAVTDPVDIASELRPVLLRIARELRRESSDLGVTASQVSLLVHISRNRGIGTCDLAELEGVSAPRISKAVDALVGLGLVGRHRGIDRRRVGFEITTKGRKVIQSVRKRRTAWLSTRLRQLDPEELERLEAAIEPLARLLEDEA
jgi:DNA-binding MarR family transcriptional regulator